MKSITDTAISRRQAVALGASAFATLGLAACGSSNSSDSGSPSKKSGGVKSLTHTEGKLTITVKTDADGDDVVIVVSDDGVGMTEETCANITQVESSTGLGIAVKNVHDRMIGFFGPDAQMVYTSVLGEGTQVTLRCPGCAKAPTSAAASASAGAPAAAEGAAQSAEKTARNNATVAELAELVAQVSE